MEYPVTAAFFEVLPNGLTIILDPDPSVPVISTQIWVETGSIHEDPLLGSGLSHFLEHMVFKGGGRFGADEMAVAVQAAGGHWNAYTTFERTVYYIDGPSTGLETFLEVLNAMVFHPALPISEFEKEKDVIRREIDMGLDDPDDVASRLLFATAFREDGRKFPVIGYKELFGQIKHEEMLSYHRSRYTPDRCCLCIAGDFDVAVVRELIQRWYAPLERGIGAEPVVLADPPMAGQRYGRETFAIPSSRLSLAWKIPALGHEDQPALDITAAILGRGRSARLYRKLREEQGLALEISAWSWAQAGREGLFAVGAECEPENREALIEAIHQEIQALQECDLDAEISKAFRQIAASQFKTLTSVSGRASDLASNWHEARDLNLTRNYVQLLSQVTADDVKRAIRRLCPSQRILTILDPEGTPAPASAENMRHQAAEAETFTLENGVTAVLLPDPRVPLFTVQVAARAGLSSETSNRAGINTLLAATLPKGTQKRSAAELALQLDSLGASLGAASGNNALLIQLSGLSPDLGALLPLLGEVLAEPALDEDSISREKASQLSSLKESLEDPLSTAFRAVREGLFGQQGYGLSSLGSETSLEELDRRALQDHHHRHICGRNLVVTMAGGFDPAEAKSLLIDSFSQLPAGDAWRAPASQIREPQEIQNHLPKKQAVLALAYPGACALAPERHALRMIQEWCSDMAGPLFTRIREELGLAYQIGATQFLGHDTGFFCFYVATDPAKVELAERELRGEIEKIATEGIPAEAFERVRATVLSSLALTQQSPGAIARAAALDVLFGLPATHYRELAGIFQSLSTEDVKRVAAQLLEREPVISRVLPAGTH
jgi:zinc protease